MKILVIDNSLDVTGASKAIVKMVQEIRSSKLIFVFIYPNRSKNDSAVISQGFTCYNLPFVEISKSINKIIQYIPFLIYNTFKLVRLIKKENITVIHVNDMFNMLGLTVKLFTGKKVITHVRRMPESFPLFLYKIWMGLNVRFSDKIIAVSESNKSAIKKNDKTVVIYDPLPDKEVLPKYYIKPELNKKIRILYLANYTFGKGQQYAIEMLEKVLIDMPDWEFSLDYYGGNFGLKKNREFKNHLQNVAIVKKVNTFINFYDASNNTEKLMKEYDLVLNLSDSESFSRVTLEALYFGVPIIATKVGGTKEMFSEEFRFLLAERMDTESMYKCFKKLITEDDLRCAFSRAMYDYVRHNFNIEKTSRKLEDIYQSI